MFSLQSCEGSGCPSVVDVFAQPPFYSGYISIVGQVPRARWNVSADPSSPYTIEILTYVSCVEHNSLIPPGHFMPSMACNCVSVSSYPNNPTGEKRAPLIKDPSRVVRDMVYYWPMYSNIDKKLSEDLMIFSR